MDMAPTCILLLPSKGVSLKEHDRSRLAGLSEPTDEDLQGDILVFHKAMALLGAAFSHELNNPLQGILGFLDLIVRTETERDKKKDLQYVLNLCLSLRNLGQHLSELSDRFPCRSARCEVKALVEPLLRLLARKASRQVSLDLDIDPGADEMEADPLLLRLALFWTIDNALSACSSKGSIRIRATRSDPEGPTIEIRDTGEGMTREAILQTGRPFTSSTSEPAKGVGLWLARRALKQMGGRMDVISEGPGLGTTVRLLLPTSAPPTDLGP